MQVLIVQSLDNRSGEIVKRPGALRHDVEDRHVAVFFTQIAAHAPESLPEHTLRRHDVRTQIVGSQLDDHNIGFIALKIPSGIGDLVERTHHAVGHGYLRSRFRIAPIAHDPPSRMSDQHVIRIEVAGRNAGPSQVAILGPGRKRLAGRQPLGSVTAGMRVADKLDQPPRCGRRRQQPAVGLYRVERRSPLLGFGPLLNRHGVRSAAEFSDKRDDRGPALDRHRAIELTIDEDIVVVTPGVRSAHRASRTVETERKMAAAPIERQAAGGVSGGTPYKADQLRIRPAGTRPAAGRTGPGRQEQRDSKEQDFHSRIILRTDESCRSRLYNRRP